MFADVRTLELALAAAPIETAPSALMNGIAALVTRAEVDSIWHRRLPHPRLGLPLGDCTEVHYN